MEFFEGMDQLTSTWVSSIRNEGLTFFFQCITQLGSAATIIALSITILVILALRRNWPDFKIFFFTVSGGELVNEALKWLIHRGRPVHPWLTTAGGFSFPSGHSLLSTVFYLILAKMVYQHFPCSAKRSLIMFSLITIPILVGISRVYLGVHFLTDVLGGWFIGCLWISYAIFIWNRSCS